MRTYNTRKRILVTGGAGFLGSHLCDKLLEQGHEVLYGVKSLLDKAEADGRL